MQCFWVQGLGLRDSGSMVNDLGFQFRVHGNLKVCFGSWVDGFEGVRKQSFS